MSKEAKFKIYNGQNWEEYTFPPSQHKHEEYAAKSTVDVLAASQLLQIKYPSVELIGEATEMSLSVPNGFKGLPIAIYSIKESSSENIIRSAIVPLFSNVECGTGFMVQNTEIRLYYNTTTKTIHERHGMESAVSYRRLMVLDLATAI